MTTSAQATDLELEALYRDLAAVDLRPLWTITEQLLTPTPRPQAVPWLWAAATMKPLARRAIQLVPVERGGERRVLSLQNPGLGGKPYAAGTLWGALQCLGPREVAPAHRHTPGAIRWVLEGEGVWTTVGGDACDMHPGDLVLTPSWNWHDHVNGGDSEMFWFDGLDLPMIEALDGVFFEEYPGPGESQPEPAEHNLSERAHPPGTRYVEGSVDGPLTPAPSPLLIYRWADTAAELDRLAAASDQPLVALEYVNPHHRRQRAADPRLRGAPGARGRADPAGPPLGQRGLRRLPGARVDSVIDGQRFDWGPGDMFVAPSWSAVEHSAAEQADLFVVDRRPRAAGARHLPGAGPARSADRHRHLHPPLNWSPVKLALFDDNRLGVVSLDGETLVDVTDALPWPHDPDPLTAGWWRALCRDFASLAPALAAAAESGADIPVSQVPLRAPALGPSKVVAAASNYGEHVAEMHGVQERTLGRVEAWMMELRRLPQGAVVDRRARLRHRPAGRRGRRGERDPPRVRTGHRDRPGWQGHPAGVGDGRRPRLHRRAGHHGAQRRPTGRGARATTRSARSGRGSSPPTSSATGRGWTSC